MIVRCDECHAMLAVETLGEWIEHQDDGSHTHHFAGAATFRPDHTNGSSS